MQISLPHLQYSQLSSTHREVYKEPYKYKVQVLNAQNHFPL